MRCHLTLKTLIYIIHMTERKEYQMCKRSLGKKKTLCVNFSGCVRRHARLSHMLPN